MNQLLLVRHGQSRWNASNKFTGWVDVGLSVRGISEAEALGEKLKDTEVDVAFVSELVRAQQTLFLVLAKQNKTGIVVHDRPKHSYVLASNILTPEDIAIFESQKLNERYYGLLQGVDKNQAREDYGPEQVIQWRRGFKSKPPEGESLEDVFKRTTPFFKNTITPFLASGKNVMVSAHGNSLRAIVKYIEKITDEQIVNLDIPTGGVIRYEYDSGQVTNRQDKLNFERKVYWTPWKQNGKLSKKK